MPGCVGEDDSSVFGANPARPAALAVRIVNTSRSDALTLARTMLFQFPASGRYMNRIMTPAVGKNHQAPIRDFFRTGASREGTNDFAGGLTGRS